MRVCRRCHMSKPEKDFPQITSKKVHDCKECFNRNSHLDCSTCPAETLDKCIELAMVRFPVLCEDWDMFEYARIGIPPEWMVEYEKDELFTRVKGEVVS